MFLCVPAIQWVVSFIVYAFFTDNLSSMGYFRVVCLVTLPLSGSEARVDLVLIQTLLLFTCKSCCSHAN